MKLGPSLRNLAFGLVSLAAFAAVLGFLRFKQYVDEDPRLCATCHRSNPEFALWIGSSHRDVACQRCHHSTPEQGLAMLRAFVAGKKPSGRHAEVEVGACASCHLSHDPRWKQVGASRGHRVHYTEHGISCVTCHATSVHGFEPVSSTCVACHGKHLVNASGMERLHCFACHQFLTDEPGLRPTRRDCLHCHTAQGIHAPMAAHGAMEIDCANCHKPHQPRATVLVSCRECHTQMARGGLHASAGHAACLDCHRPHTWTARVSDCLRCHRDAKGHAEQKPCTSCHAFGGAPLPPLPAAVTTP
jgi:hypothetical protein